ncbi:MAG: hypothetical protein EZS28_022636, partial [Streblomastix strix]
MPFHTPTLEIPNVLQRGIIKTQSQALDFYLNQRIQQVTTSFIEYNPNIWVRSSKIKLSSTRGREPQHVD